jgi:hypothetical protein
MARAKPRKGWDPVGTKDRQYFSVGDLKELLRNEDVAVSSSVRERDLEKIASLLESATNMYDTFKMDQSRPTPSQIKAALEKLKRTADALIGAMKDLDYDCKNLLLLWMEDARQAAGNLQGYFQDVHQTVHQEAK